MQKELNYIKEVCRSFFPDCKIVLFGSRANGYYEHNSDYDFMIITEEELSVKQKLEYKAKIRKLLADYKIPADVLIQSKNEVDTKKNIIGHIVKQAVTKGIVL